MNKSEGQAEAKIDKGGCEAQAKKGEWLWGRGKNE